MKITANKVVAVTYDLNVGEGEERELMERATAETPLKFIFGTGAMLPAFEDALKGLEVGDKFNFSITPADAYGEYVEEHVLDLPKNIFEVDGKFDSEMIKEGNTVPMMDSNGNRMNGSVLEVKEDVVVMDLQGNIVDSKRTPSSEHSLHAAFYLEKPDARAVVHAHSMYCTTLACAGVDLKATHYAIADTGVATVPTVPYETYGTPELADEVRKCLRESDSKALLMANHGMVAYGDSLEKAFAIANTCEWCAQVQWRAMAISTPNVLSDEQMAEVIEHYKTYGQAKEDGKQSQGYFG